jgi:hypothetical protein
MGKKKTLIEIKDLLSVRVKNLYSDVFFAEHNTIGENEFLCIVIDIYDDDQEGQIYDVVPLEHALMRGEKLFITREEFVIKKLS